jgi:hypothetical protein
MGGRCGACLSNTEKVPLFFSARRGGLLATSTAGQSDTAWHASWLPSILSHLLDLRRLTTACTNLRPTRRAFSSSRDIQAQSSRDAVCLGLGRWYCTAYDFSLQLFGLSQLIEPAFGTNRCEHHLPPFPTAPTTVSSFMYCLVQQESSVMSMQHSHDVKLI